MIMMKQTIDIERIFQIISIFFLLLLVIIYSSRILYYVLVKG